MLGDERLAARAVSERAAHIDHEGRPRPGRQPEHEALVGHPIAQAGHRPADSAAAGDARQVEDHVRRIVLQRAPGKAVHRAAQHPGSRHG